MCFLKIKLIIIAVILALTPVAARAATEFTSIVDPDNASGTDYTALSSWESGVQTDLTSAATQVFSGTRTSAIADNATVYLCRSGAYQTHYGTVVHVTATQILVESISGSATEQSGDIWYTNNSCNSSNYFTLSNGGDSAIAVASARASAGTADTTAVTIDGWTTSATNYIKVWTDPSLGNRHNGKWDDSKYHLSVNLGATSDAKVLKIADPYVKITGLQISQTGTGSYQDGIYPEGWNFQGIEIDSDIIKNTGTLSEYQAAFGIGGLYAANLKIYNTLIYDYKNVNNAGGIHVGNLNSAYIYNVSIINSTTGIYGSTSAETVKNVLVQGAVPGQSFHGTYNSASDYNATDDSTSTGGAHDKINQSFAFIDLTHDDFHLAPTDTAARGAGTDLSADANLAVTTDIDNSLRTGSWDIGADEAPQTTINAPNNNGLVGYWNFEEGAGTKAGDMSGRGKDGTISGASWVAGKRGQALSFNGTSNYIDAGNVYNGVKTISFWLKADTTTNRIIDLNGTAKVELSSGTITTSGITSPTIYVDGAESSTVDANWHFVTIKTDTGINASAMTLGQGDSWACGDPITYCGDSYATVQMTSGYGSQCWLQENLRNTTKPDCTTAITNYCHGSGCGSPWGRLYTWTTAMNGSTTATGCGAKIQGICPSGWHIPSDYTSCATDDFPALGTDGGALKKVNTSSGVPWTEPNTGATNTSNWTGYPAGFWSSGFFNRGGYGYFWSSAENNGFSAWNRSLNYGSAGWNRVNSTKSSGFSLRCVKDDLNPSYSYFSGRLDEVRMYNRALSPTEITALYNSRAAVINSPQNDRLTSGLVGLWSFNGPDVNMTTNTAYDRAGSNNGTISGATQAIGKIGQALNFDGSNDDIIVSNESNFDFDRDDNFSLSAWIYRETSDTEDAILGKIEDNVNWIGYSLWLPPSGNCDGSNSNCLEVDITGTVGAISVQTPADSVPIDSWTHVVATYNGNSQGSGVVIYFNGEVQAPTVINDNASGTSLHNNNFTIGTDLGGETADYFNGKIDEVRVYNRALSAGEVQQLYNMGR